MRKKRSILNIIATLGASFSAIIFNFISQKFIISILGIEYSGANGLFTNILNMLSIAELGLSSAIIFKLYKPIAENDIEKIKSWMKFYKICYRYIAIFILVIGLIIVPFVPMIVGNTTIKENIILLYFISLLDVVLSYTLTYKRSLLYAQQKNYIINIIHMFYLILVNIFQIAILVITNKYIFYICIKILFRLLENIVINIYVNKNNPYMKEKAVSITQDEKKDIFARIKAIFVQKISYQINKGIDNVIITSMLGIAITGYYTNYSLIVIAILRILFWITTSLTASVGNLLTENNKEKSYSIYKKISLLNAFITCLSVVGFVCCVQKFITIWLGKKYLLSIYIIFSFAFYIYSDSIRNIIRLFKEASGICRNDRNTYIVAVIINIFFSIILCYFIGIPGVVLGTAISYMYLYLYSYPKYIYRKLFEKNYKLYYVENFKYFIYILITTIISFLLCKNITLHNNFIDLLVYILISVSTTLLFFVVMFKKSKEFKYYIINLKKIFKRKKNYYE